MRDRVHDFVSGDAYVPLIVRGLSRAEDEYPATPILIGATNIHLVINDRNASGDVAGRRWIDDDAHSGFECRLGRKHLGLYADDHAVRNHQTANGADEDRSPHGSIEAQSLNRDPGPERLDNERPPSTRDRRQVSLIT